MVAREEATTRQQAEDEPAKTGQSQGAQINEEQLSLHHLGFTVCLDCGWWKVRQCKIVYTSS
jgi:hypothetical protein